MTSIISGSQGGGFWVEGIAIKSPTHHKMPNFTDMSIPIDSAYCLGRFLYTDILPYRILLSARCTFLTTTNY